MKKSIALIVVFLINLSNLYSTDILAPPKVDIRVELLSIVFRLAECREYSSQRFPAYVERIEKHFAKHKDHALITYVKEDLRPNGVAYDAVMQMAIYLSDSYPYKPLVPFSAKVPESRWGKKRATKFVELLNDFYQTADCKTFFEENKDLYALASSRFEQVYKELDVQWYEDFYGEKPKGTFRIVNGLGNGGGNYGPKTLIDGEETVYAIMGTWSVDSLGVPVYKVKSYFPTMLHEFNHSFVNHLVDKHAKALSKSGEILFEPLQGRMAVQAYSTWRTMYCEAIVRAAVIKYLRDHDYPEDYIEAGIQREVNRGFLWTRELVDELERYDQHRDDYPSLESFMPEIVRFFDMQAQNIASLESKIAAFRPKVQSMWPFENGSQEVDPSTTRIAIVFDRPLSGRRYSINRGPKGKKAYPKMNKIRFSDDRKSVYIDVELKANKQYQFILTGLAFRSEEGYGMEDYQVEFKTRKE